MAIGENCFVRIGLNPKDAEIIGYVTKFCYEIRTQVLEVSVIGHLEPIDIDNQSYTLIAIERFIPRKDLFPEGTNLSEHVSLTKILPKLESHRALSDNIFIYLDFFDKKKDKIIAGFHNVRVNYDGFSMVAT